MIKGIVMTLLDRAQRDINRNREYFIRNTKDRRQQPRLMVKDKRRWVRREIDQAKSETKGDL